jgi:hypothetical protein
MTEMSIKQVDKKCWSLKKPEVALCHVLIHLLFSFPRRRTIIGKFRTHKNHETYVVIGWRLASIADEYGIL